MQNQDQINLLLAKLESLLKRQESFSKETEALREELLQLKATSATKKEEKDARTTITVLIDQDLRDWVEAQARADDRSLSNWVVRVLSEKRAAAS